jgi:hypothetical protein
MLAVLVSGCEVLIMLPSSSGLSTSVPGMFETIVAGTAAAAQSQTAAVIPSTFTSTWTPLPTRTPSLTPTPTPTFIFLLGGARTPVIFATPAAGATSTDTGSFSEVLDGCTLLSQTPADGSHFAAKASFTAAWKVKNTGTFRWDVDTVDFAYFSGTRMYARQVYHLPVDIPRGQYVTLKVPMTAPKNTGTYLTTWSLRRGQVAYPNPGDKSFCHVDLRIRVP